MTGAEGVFGAVLVFSVPVWMSYRSCQKFRYRYWCRTELIEVSRTGMKICTCTGGTGIHVLPNLPKYQVPVLMPHRTYQSVRYRYWCCTETTEVVWKSVPVPAVPVSIWHRTCPSVRYRNWCRTELTEVSSTGIDITPNLPRRPVRLLMSHRTWRSFWYRYWCRTELTEVSRTGTGVVPKLSKDPVPVLISHRTYRSVWYRYWCRTELTEVSRTGIGVLPNLSKDPVLVLVSYRYFRSVRYRYWCRTELTEASGTGNTGDIFRRYVSYLPCRTHHSSECTFWIINWKKCKNGGSPWTWRKTSNLHFLGWSHASRIPRFRFSSGLKIKSCLRKTKRASCAKSDAEMVLGSFVCLLVRVST